LNKAENIIIEISQIKPNSDSAKEQIDITIRYLT
jgi:hypothetical protein